MIIVDENLNVYMEINMSKAFASKHPVIEINGDPAPQVVYTSNQTIIDNHSKFVKICNNYNKLLKTKFPDASNTTWIYDQYNIFSYTSTSAIFYDLYKDLNKIIRDYVGDDRRIWMQSWLNFLSYDEIVHVLGPHNHKWDIHGYISIDPKNTTTEFTDFDIKNEIGNIYIGPGGDYHEVVNDGEWNGSRITIGFDLTFDEDRPQTDRQLFPIL